MYRTLDARGIIHSISTLQRRIEERFPDSGLGKVCGDFLSVAEASGRTAERIARPNILLRLAVALAIAAVLAVAAAAVVTFDAPNRQFDLASVVQVGEAAMNVVILVGAFLLFLFTVEARIKRHRTQGALHELRSLAHVVDMHQLTKDPEKILRKGPSTASSPRRTMTDFELSRYLDYCCEMLSLIGKVAALYVQGFNDPVAVSSVNEIESLTTGLSRKVWQKIMLVNSMDLGSTPRAIGAHPPAAAPPAP